MSGSTRFVYFLKRFDDVNTVLSSYLVVRSSHLKQKHKGICFDSCASSEQF